MVAYLKSAKISFKCVVIVVCSAVFFTSFTYYIFNYRAVSYASIVDMPLTGAMLSQIKPQITNHAGHLPILKGISFDRSRPLSLEFFFDSMQKKSIDQVQIQRLIKYFLGFLAIPADKLWVNLSPYEPQRIIPETLGQLDIGKDMLIEDYVLKQLTSSLLDVRNPYGRNFWKDVHRAAKSIAKTTNIPLKMFYKIWIVPDAVTVYEHKDLADNGKYTISINEAKLRVMIEDDYLAYCKGVTPSLESDFQKRDNKEQINVLAKDIFKQKILPLIEDEVNHGESFALLRQLYYCLILAHYFKNNRDIQPFYAQYIDREFAQAIAITNPDKKKKIIYQAYIKNIQKANTFLQTEYDVSLRKKIRRRYFSGGIEWSKIPSNGAVAKPVDFSRCARVYTKIKKPGSKVGTQTLRKPVRKGSPLQCINNWYSDVAKRSKAFTVKEIMAWRNYSETTVRQELETLVELGIVVKKKHDEKTKLSSEFCLIPELQNDSPQARQAMEKIASLDELNAAAPLIKNKTNLVQVIRVILLGLRLAYKKDELVQKENFEEECTLKAFQRFDLLIEIAQKLSVFPNNSDYFNRYMNVVEKHLVNQSSQTIDLIMGYLPTFRVLYHYLLLCQIGTGNYGLWEIQQYITELEDKASEWGISVSFASVSSLFYLPGLPIIGSRGYISEKELSIVKQASELITRSGWKIKNQDIIASTHEFEFHPKRRGGALGGFGDNTNTGIIVNTPGKTAAVMIHEMTHRYILSQPWWRKIHLFEKTHKVPEILAYPYLEPTNNGLPENLLNELTAYVTENEFVYELFQQNLVDISAEKELLSSMLFYMDGSLNVINRLNSYPLDDVYKPWFNDVSQRWERLKANVLQMIVDKQLHQYIKEEVLLGVDNAVHDKVDGFLGGNSFYTDDLSYSYKLAALMYRYFPMNRQEYFDVLAEHFMRNGDIGDGLEADYFPGEWKETLKELGDKQFKEYVFSMPKIPDKDKGLMINRLLGHDAIMKKLNSLEWEERFEGYKLLLESVQFGKHPRQGKYVSLFVEKIQEESHEHLKQLRDLEMKLHPVCNRALGERLWACDSAFWGRGYKRLPAKNPSQHIVNQDIMRAEQEKRVTSLLTPAVEKKGFPVLFKSPQEFFDTITRYARADNPEVKRVAQQMVEHLTSGGIQLKVIHSRNQFDMGFGGKDGDPDSFFTVRRTGKGIAIYCKSALLQRPNALRLLIQGIAHEFAEHFDHKSHSQACLYECYFSADDWQYRSFSELTYLAIKYAIEQKNVPYLEELYRNLDEVKKKQAHPNDSQGEFVDVVKKALVQVNGGIDFRAQMFGKQTHIPLLPQNYTNQVPQDLTFEIIAIVPPCVTK